MKSIYMISIACALFVAACNIEPAKEPATEQALETPKEKIVYGKIKHVDVGVDIDKAMAKGGFEVFDTKCSACHKLDERYVGPALGKVTERRTPEFVMNMILDTETMIDNDDTVKCLMQEYLMRMPNQSVGEKDARNVLEYLRQAAKEDDDKDDDDDSKDGKKKS